MEPILIDHNRRKFAWNRTGHTIITACVTMAAVSGGDIGILPMAFVAGGLAWWSHRRVHTKTVALLINDEGITDDSSYLPGGLVKWEEIKSVEYLHYMGHRHIAVYLHDVETYLSRVPAWLQGSHRSNSGVWGTPCVIAAANLNVPLDEAKEAIEWGLREWQARQAVRQPVTYGEVQTTAGAAVAPTNMPSPSGPRHWWTSVPPEERTVQVGRNTDR